MPHHPHLTARAVILSQQEIYHLAAEIQATERVDWDTAVSLACAFILKMAFDLDANVRYRPVGLKLVEVRDA